MKKAVMKMLTELMMDNELTIPFRIVKVMDKERRWWIPFRGRRSGR